MNLIKTAAVSVPDFRAFYISLINSFPQSNHTKSPENINTNERLRKNQMNTSSYSGAVSSLVSRVIKYSDFDFSVHFDSSFNNILKDLLVSPSLSIVILGDNQKLNIAGRW